MASINSVKVGISQICDCVEKRLDKVTSKDFDMQVKGEYHDRGDFVEFPLLTRMDTKQFAFRFENANNRGRKLHVLIYQLAKDGIEQVGNFLVLPGETSTFTRPNGCNDSFTAMTVEKARFSRIVPSKGRCDTLGTFFVYTVLSEPVPFRGEFFIYTPASFTRPIQSFFNYREKSRWRLIYRGYR